MIRHVVGLVGGWLLFAQPLAVNTGVDLYLQPGGRIWCQGGWENRAGGTFQNQGRVHISGDIRNDDNRQLFVPGAVPGELVLNGGLQRLSGSFPIRTDTLILEGTDPKVLETDLYIDQALILNDAELRTQGRFAAVRNPDPGAISRRSGFVSSDPGGYLERATAQTASYLFPVGGHTPQRYRPVEITPSSAAPHRYAVRLANADPNTENFPRDQRTPDLCEINPLYFHYIQRLEGSAPADIRVFYDPSDAVKGPLAQWKTALWVSTPASAISSGWQLSGWNDFSDPYFAFSQERLSVQLQGTPDTVEVGQPVQLTASTQPPAPAYEWNFGDGTLRSGSSTQSYAYNQPGVYTVQVVAPPCSDTASLRVVVVAPSLLSIYNTFTPNNDGINDFWQPVVRGQVRSLRWSIYDRWGILIAQGEGTTARWDGTKDGQACAEGAYIYVVEAELLSGEKVQRTGTLSLLR